MQYGRVLVLAVAAACGGGSGGGGMDAGPGADAVADAGIDGGMAPDADPLADTDGDGVLDTADVCPLVADPAQVDLDGDHIGWMCDSVESTTIPFTGATGGSVFAARGNTMGGALAYACVDAACMHASFAVGPGGISRADGQTDPWLQGRPSIAFVGAENHVLWSMLDGVLGDQDATTDTFTPRQTGRSLGSFYGYGVARYERRDLLVLSSEPRDSTTDPYMLLAPQTNGDVIAIATSTSAFVRPTIVGDNPARLVFGTSDPGQRALREFVPGSSDSQPIVVDGTPLSNADAVVMLTGQSNSAMFGFCVDQGGKRYIVETIHDQLRAYEAPLSSCGVSPQPTNDLQATLFTQEGGTFLVVDGVIHPLAIDGTLKGTNLPAVITEHTPPTEAVHVIDATGALHPVTSDGLASNVSTEGDTVHFLSFHQGTFSLVRFRDGTTTQVPVPAPAFAEGESSWDVFTTKEGAALVSTNSRALVWPSQASVATEVDFDHIEALVRGDATFFVASHNDPRSQPALYSYSEVGGVPQYTPLTPEVVQNVSFTMTLVPLGYSMPASTVGLPATTWFAYTKNGECHLVRPVGTGATVSLLGDFSCAGGVAIRGFTPSGAAVVEFTGSLSFPKIYVLENNTMTKVVEGKQLRFLYAAPESPLLLGWWGRDVVDGTFLCSATHPDRCWSTPSEPEVWGPIDPAQPDGLHVMFTHGTSSSIVFTSIRTFGPGNRAQPL